MAKSRLLVIALLISLGINFAIGGFMVARWIYHDGPRGHSASLTFNRWEAMKTLPEEQRADIHELWKDNKPEIRENFRAYRKARRHISKLLAEDPLDKAAIDAAYKVLVDRKSRIETLLYGTMIRTAEALPPEQRKIFFQQGFKRWKERSRYKRPHDKMEKKSHE